MPEGCKIALVLQLGSPVKTVLRFEHPDPHPASCPAFLESVPDEGGPSGLEPIAGDHRAPTVAGSPSAGGDPRRRPGEPN